MMSYALFQTVPVMPMNTQLGTNNFSPKPSLRILKLGLVRPFPNSAVAVKFRWRSLVAKASSAAGIEKGSAPFLERCFEGPTVPETSGSLSASSSPPSRGPIMKDWQYGASSAVTLEKSKPDLSQKESQFIPELDLWGGSGGIGNIIHLGGGGGGGGDGDDDDYFNDFDDGDEGDEGGLFRTRMFLEELFDRKFVDAVLNEWQKTMMDLPAFIYRLLLEEAATIGFSVWWEFENRKDRIRQERDLALINVLTVAACNAAVVWSLAPCRSYGKTFRFDLQNTLQKVPNNIFENSYPLREFDLQKRIQCFFFKAAELCVVGLGAGAVQGALSNTVANKKEGRCEGLKLSLVSVTVPSMRINAFGYGAFLGIYANLRYQLLCGFDKAMINHFDVIGVSLLFSTAFRILNVKFGETFRGAWLGVETDSLSQSDDMLKVYNRPSENVEKQSWKWFISKNSVTSRLGPDLAIKQGKADSMANAKSSAPKTRRKRIARKKVATRSS